MDGLVYRIYAPGFEPRARQPRVQWSTTARDLTHSVTQTWSRALPIRQSYNDIIAMAMAISS